MHIHKLTKKKSDELLAEIHEKFFKPFNRGICVRLPKR